MLDVAIRGIGDHWNDVILPDLDYLVIENTLGKFGERVENFNSLPINVQSLVGKGCVDGTRRTGWNQKRKSMASLTPEKLLELEEAAYQIRRLSIEMITYARWGHPGGSLSMADILAVLYFQVMNIDPHEPQCGRARSADPIQGALLAGSLCCPGVEGLLSPGGNLYLLRTGRSGRSYRYDPHRRASNPPADRWGWVFRWQSAAPTGCA